MSWLSSLSGFKKRSERPLPVNPSSSAPHSHRCTTIIQPILYGINCWYARGLYLSLPSNGYFTAFKPLRASKSFFTAIRANARVRTTSNAQAYQLTNLIGRHVLRSHFWRQLHNFRAKRDRQPSFSDVQGYALAALTQPFQVHPSSTPPSCIGLRYTS